MLNADRITIRRDLTFTGMVTAIRADTMVMDIRTRKLIAVVFSGDMTKVSGATVVTTAATMETMVDARRFPGN